MYTLEPEPCTTARADATPKCWAISLAIAGGFTVYRNITFLLPLIYVKWKKTDTKEICANSIFPP